MLAYVFWHWKRDSVATPPYEDHLRGFHEALRAAPSPGLTRSWCAALTGAPWANAGRDAYEDWYVTRGSADLDPLNEAAVSASRQAPHDRAAAGAADGTAGLYRLRAGTLVPVPAHAAWFAKPGGWSYAALYESLDQLTRGGAALWGRQMTLGPATEFVLHGNAPLLVPAGIDARHVTLRAVFPASA